MPTTKTQFKPLTKMQALILEGRFGLPVDAAEWHIHANGGGYIHNGCQVPEDVYVDERATIRGGTIRGGTI
jgi:hypothetical protein